MARPVQKYKITHVHLSIFALLIRGTNYMLIDVCRKTQSFKALALYVLPRTQSTTLMHTQTRRKIYISVSRRRYSGNTNLASPQTVHGLFSIRRPPALTDALTDGSGGVMLTKKLMD